MLDRLPFCTIEKYCQRPQYYLRAVYTGDLLAQKRRLRRKCHLFLWTLSNTTTYAMFAVAVARVLRPHFAHVNAPLGKFFGATTFSITIKTRHPAQRHSAWWDWALWTVSIRHCHLSWVSIFDTVTLSVFMLKVIMLMSLCWMSLCWVSRLQVFLLLRLEYCYCSQPSKGPKC